MSRRPQAPRPSGLCLAGRWSRSLRGLLRQDDGTQQRGRLRKDLERHYRIRESWRAQDRPQPLSRHVRKHLGVGSTLSDFALYHAGRHGLEYLTVQRIAILLAQLAGLRFHPECAPLHYARSASIWRDPRLCCARQELMIGIDCARCRLILTWAAIDPVATHCLNCFRTLVRIKTNTPPKTSGGYGLTILAKNSNDLVDNGLQPNHQFQGKPMRREAPRWRKELAMAKNNCVAYRITARHNSIARWIHHGTNSALARR